MSVGCKDGEGAGLIPDLCILGADLDLGTRERGGDESEDSRGCFGGSALRKGSSLLSKSALSSLEGVMGARVFESVDDCEDEAGEEREGDAFVSSGVQSKSG